LDSGGVLGYEGVTASLAAQPKIDELRPVVRVQQDVLRLEITVRFIIRESGGSWVEVGLAGQAGLGCT